jgi:hypothetical protein
MKRVFGDTLRSKTPVAQINETLMRVIAHNIVLSRSLHLRAERAGVGLLNLHPKCGCCT